MINGFIRAPLVIIAVLVASDPSATGLPRVTKLADGVFAYEQLDPTKQGVTANNLIVVTNEGVLVADGQGTVENTRRLVSDIATVTPQLISKNAEPTYRMALERVIAEGRRLHDGRVPVDEAADRADFGEFSGWWRKTENAPGAMKRVYMALDGELNPPK